MQRMRVVWCSARIYCIIHGPCECLARIHCSCEKGVHFHHEYTYCAMNIVHLITVLNLGLFSICGFTPPPRTHTHTHTHTVTTTNITLLAAHTHMQLNSIYTTPTFSSFVQVVDCVLYWPCPTQSSGWSHPTDVDSWVWSPSSGQTPGGDVPLWCEWGGW